MKTAYALAALLAFAVLTLWVRARWAVSAVEAGSFLTACIILIARRGRIQLGLPLLTPAMMCAWAALQWAAHWTAVPSMTADACLYWLAAASVMLIAAQADREVFLNAAFAIGAAVCITGTVQLFSSRGNVFWWFPSGYTSGVIGPFVSPNNYACFVELLIPVALAVADRPQASRRKPAYLLIAAALAATVVASGSRTGAVLVLLEFAAVLSLQKWARRPLAAFAALTIVLASIVGVQFLAGRFAQHGDFFAVRREFLISSIAMFRARPLHGFGLGAWTAAYPQFALIDTGKVANHAHNEWIQWAAEGGAPAAAIMLALLLWTIRSAFRSVWGIGLLAVFVHAAVDYPFLRLGLAVWIFAFLGALTPRTRIVNLRIPAAAAIPILLFGVWLAGKLAYADALYHRATLASVEQAAALAPDRAEYQFTLAALDPAKAADHLTRALADNPYDTLSRVGLALERETSGDPDSAARLLAEAARNDHQFAPAWALANFYYRQNDAAKFWKWAERAAAMSFDDRRSLFDLCFLAAGDAEGVFQKPETVFEKIVAPLPALDAPFLNYLTVRRHFDAGEVVQRIAQRSASTTREALADYIDAAIAAGDIGAAWQARQASGPQPLLINGDFARPPLNRGFDWKLPTAAGIALSRTSDQGPALSISLSGAQPESCELLSHILPLAPGAGYAIQFEYRTVDLPARSGIFWRLGDAIEPGWNSSTEWSRAQWPFQAASARNLELIYTRPPGVTRAEGRIFIRNVRIEPSPAIDSALRADRASMTFPSRVNLRPKEKPGGPSPASSVQNPVQRPTALTDHKE